MGHSRTGAAASGLPLGDTRLSPDHLRAGHEKGETNLISLCKAVEESRKLGPAFSLSLGPCSQPYRPHICQLGLGNVLL